MIGSLLFINQKGEIVIHRTYRDNFSRTMADAFRTQASLNAPAARAAAAAARARARRADARAPRALAAGDRD